MLEMKITVIAKPNSKREKIEIIDERTLKIFVTYPAIDNKANHESSISIIRGQKSKLKIIEIYRL